VARWHPAVDSGEAKVSAEIIQLCERGGGIVDLDLLTAVDVAIRDLREIEAHWGTELAFERLAECRAMLAAVLSTA